MRVRLLREARIPHGAGEILEVSPAVGGFLVSVGSAVIEAEEAETPEAFMNPPQGIETPEGPKKRTRRRK